MSAAFEITRRTALTALAASAGLPSLRASPSHNMFLSLNSVLIGGRVPWPEFARLAAKVGFPGTDVDLDAAMKLGVNATKDLLADLNLRPACLNFPVEFRKDDATFQTGMPKLRDAAVFAAGIGCPRMMTWIMSSSTIPKWSCAKRIWSVSPKPRTLCPTPMCGWVWSFLGHCTFASSFPMSSFGRCRRCWNSPWNAARTWA